MKKTPMRMCVACRNMFPKSEMTRVVQKPNGDFVLDPTGKLNGRGAYVCNSNTCINKCVKAHLFNRSFKTNIDEKIYEDVKENTVGEDK